MVVICHPAGMILSGAKIAPMVKSMVPEYYSARGEDCPPRLDEDMEEFFSEKEE